MSALKYRVKKEKENDKKFFSNKKQLSFSIKRLFVSIIIFKIVLFITIQFGIYGGLLKILCLNVNKTAKKIP